MSPGLPQDGEGVQNASAGTFLKDLNSYGGQWFSYLSLWHISSLWLVGKFNSLTFPK